MLRQSNWWVKGCRYGSTLTAFVFSAALAPAPLAAQDSNFLSRTAKQILTESIDAMHCLDGVRQGQTGVFYGIHHSHPSFTTRELKSINQAIDAGLDSASNTLTFNSPSAFGDLAPVLSNATGVDQMTAALERLQLAHYVVIVTAERPAPDVVMLVFNVFERKADGGVAVCMQNDQATILVKISDKSDATAIMLNSTDVQHFRDEKGFVHGLGRLREFLRDWPNEVPLKISVPECELGKELAGRLRAAWTGAGDLPGTVFGSTGPDGAGEGVYVRFDLDSQSDRAVVMTSYYQSAKNGQHAVDITRLLVSPEKLAACRQELLPDPKFKDVQDRLNSEIQARIQAEQTIQQLKSDGLASVEQVIEDLRAEGRGDLADHVAQSRDIAERESLPKDKMRVFLKELLKALHIAPLKEPVVIGNVGLEIVRPVETTFFSQTYVQGECREDVTGEIEDGVVHLSGRNGCRNAVVPVILDGGAQTSKHLSADHTGERFDLHLPLAQTGLTLKVQGQRGAAPYEISLPETTPSGRQIVLEWTDPIDLDLHVLEGPVRKDELGHVTKSRDGAGQVILDQTARSPQSPRYAIYAAGALTAPSYRVKVRFVPNSGTCTPRTTRFFVHVFENGQQVSRSGAVNVDCSGALVEVPWL